MLWAPSDATADAEGFVLSRSFDKPAALAMKAYSSNKKKKKSHGTMYFCFAEQFLNGTG